MPSPEKLKELRVKEENLKIAEPSANYPGVGCGYTWDEWFVVTWRALQKAAARRKRGSA